MYVRALLTIRRAATWWSSEALRSGQSDFQLQLSISIALRAAVYCLVVVVAEPVHQADMRDVLHNFT